MQNKRCQLATSLAVVREDNAGPAVARTNRIPVRERRLNRTVRRRTKPCVHDLVHQIRHALVRQTHIDGRPAVGRTEREVLLRPLWPILHTVARVGIS